jgi:hypothetical protein
VLRVHDVAVGNTLGSACVYIYSIHDALRVDRIQGLSQIERTQMWLEQPKQ